MTWEPEVKDLGFCQNSGLRVTKACDLAFLAPALRFETGQLLLTFMADFGVEP